ncbi:hypothetical protein [Prescottella equi]|uniref:hypothetical protein n=1 Tax=Rhodococcus hoagii TaxID=43767 RepID=UPI00384B14EA
MTNRIESNAADCHRATALLRARITGDSASFDQHVIVAHEIGRLPHLAGPLIEIAAAFMAAMMAKEAVTPEAVLNWLNRAESELMSVELAEGGVDD